MQYSFYYGHWIFNASDCLHLLCCLLYAKYWGAFWSNFHIDMCTIRTCNFINVLFLFSARYHDAYSNDAGYTSPYDTFQGGPNPGGPAGSDSGLWGPPSELQHAGFLTPDKMAGAYPPAGPCFTGILVLQIERLLFLNYNFNQCFHF